MKMKDLVELKNKDKKELERKIKEMEKSLVETRLELKLGKIKNVHEVNKKRKELAQALTILSLKALTDTKKKKGVKNGAD